MLNVHKYSFFFFNDTATTEIYTLSLHDALPISRLASPFASAGKLGMSASHPSGSSPRSIRSSSRDSAGCRSEEHTSELQSRQYLVCRLLLEKKKNTTTPSSLHLPTYHSPVHITF